MRAQNFGYIAGAPDPLRVIAARPDRGRVEVGDANLALVVINAHFDGPDASTGLIDSSPAAHTLTAAGNAQIDVDQSKFGGASLLLDGNGDFVSSADSADWNFGAGDFTVEAWIRCVDTTLVTTQVVASQWDSDGVANLAWVFYIGTDGKINFLVSDDGTNVAYTLAGGTVLSDATWCHVAAVRNGGNAYLFVNGAQDATASPSGTMSNSTAVLAIGKVVSAGTPSYYAGHVDDLRGTKFARYTAAFTPPARPNPNFAGGINRVIRH